MSGLLASWGAAGARLGGRPVLEWPAGLTCWDPGQYAIDLFVGFISSGADQIPAEPGTPTPTFAPTLGANREKTTMEKPCATRLPGGRSLPRFYPLNFDSLLDCELEASVE